MLLKSSFFGLVFRRSDIKNEHLLPEGKMDIINKHSTRFIYLHMFLRIKPPLILLLLFEFQFRYFSFRVAIYS